MTVFQVQTPEHLLAAALLLDIDNLLIHIDGPEIPILDGSAWPWVHPDPSLLESPDRSRGARSGIHSMLNTKADQSKLSVSHSDPFH